MKIDRRAAGLLLLTAAGSALAGLQPTDDPQSSPVWQKVQASLFEGRPIAPAAAPRHRRAAPPPPAGGGSP